MKRNFIKILGPLFLVAIFFISCSKADDGSVEEDQDKSTLSFIPLLDDLSSLRERSKQITGVLPACSDHVPAYVQIILSNKEGTVLGTEEEPFRINFNTGVSSWQIPELQLKPGIYFLDFFAVYNSNNELIQLAPKDGAMADISEKSLPLEIKLGAGLNKYVDVPLLCFDERLQDEYGYAFFEQKNETIPFCIFGTYCNPDGIEGTALFSVNVWEFSGEVQEPKGDVYFTDQRNPLVVADFENHAEYEAFELCLELPNSDGLDKYYVEISLEGYIQNYELFTLDPVMLRAGVISDRQLRSLFSGEKKSDYFHFREGNCGQKDKPHLFNKDLDKISGSTAGEAEAFF